MKPPPDNAGSESFEPSQLQCLVVELLKSRVRALSIVASDRGIILSGFCDSFHAKQMAQEIVSQHSHLAIVANNLVVEYSPDCDRSRIERD